jgi:hypothetical protein
MADEKDLSRRAFAKGAAATIAGTAAGTAAGATPLAGLRPPLPVEDRLALLDLMARYAWGYDTGNLALFAGTFTLNGVLEVLGKVMAQGREQMGAFLDSAATMRGPHGWQHRTDQHVFRDVAANRCTVYSYYLLPESDANGGNVTLRAMGYYVSHCVRVDGEWLFSRREVHRWNGRLPWAPA